MIETEFTPGFRFKDGKLFCFGERSAVIVSTWPELRSVKRSAASGKWSPCWPVFRLIYPYRRSARGAAGKSGSAEQLCFNLGIRGYVDLSDQRKRAFDSYRFSFPKDIANGVERFQSKQWSILHLLKAEPEVIDLVRTNPALVYLLAHEFIDQYRGEKAWPRFNGYQQRVLARRLGFPATESAVNMLKKIPAESVSLPRLKRLRTAMLQPENQKHLSHVSVLNAGVIELVCDDQLRDLWTPRLLENVSGSLHEKYRAATAEMLHEILAMRQTVCPERKLQFQSLTQLHRVHDELSAEYRRRMPAVFEGWSFPRPPVTGAPNCIVPILSPVELAKEGEAQANCVASYGRRVLDGNVFIYRVLYPERATLSLVRSEDGQWRLGELRAARNMPVQPATEHVVEYWLAQSAIVD
jgi:hypothetical protein